jgi:DNA-binding transcriptional LysR family regulator
MELRHLRYFTAVADSGGIGRASRMLNISQSAVSETIRDLENELGVDLFERSNRRIRPTAAGMLFLDDAKATLASASRAIENVKRAEKGEVGTLTIGFFAGALGSFVPKLINEFRRRFQGVQISLMDMVPSQQEKALQNGTIDVGFTRPLEAAHALSLRSERFQTEKLLAVLPKAHRLARGKDVPMKELAGERFVLNDPKYSPALFNAVMSLCAEANFAPEIAATASTSAGVVALVAAGEGTAILPQYSRIFSDDLSFLPVRSTLASIDIVLAWSPQRETPVVRSFLELARLRPRHLNASGMSRS